MKNSLLRCCDIHCLLWNYSTVARQLVHTQMSCVGLSCVILLSSGQLRVAIIRASSQALYPDSDLSTIRVCHHVTIN